MRKLFAILVVFLFSAVGAAAQSPGITMAELKSMLDAGNVAYEQRRANEIAVGKNFLYLDQCDGAGRCTEICLYNNYVDVFPTLEAVNAWNNSRKIPEASINSDGTLHMELWLSGVGANGTIIIDTIGWFGAYAADLEFWSKFLSDASA